MFSPWVPIAMVVAMASLIGFGVYYTMHADCSAFANATVANMPVRCLKEYGVTAVPAVPIH